MSIPMSSPDLTDAEMAAVTQVLGTPFLSLGPQLTAFELVGQVSIPLPPGYQRDDFPVTERLGDTSLALPFSGVMTEEQADYVCRQLQVSVSQTASAAFV